MKDEEQSRVALYHQRKRRRHKIRLALESLIFIVIAIVLIVSYFDLSKDEYNTYTEKAKVDYVVNLKENEFYENNQVDEKMNVVASLIKDFEIEFKYNLDLAKEQEYTYNYKILAKTTVKEGSRANSIYETTEELLNKETQTSNSKNLEISEKLNIDYNEYNDKISKFISAYNLSNTTNTLELDMYVYVTNQYDGKQINAESKVMTLNIPLTTKTVEIGIGSNVIQDEGQILSKESEYENITWVLAVGVVSAFIGLVIFILLIKYIIDNRRAETMYRQELKSILFNYKNYVQAVNEDIDASSYKVIKINTFNEILGMKETLQAPILMYTDEKEERTKFMIIKDNLLYVNTLGSKEIREELRAKSAMRNEKENKK